MRPMADSLNKDRAQPMPSGHLLRRVSNKSRRIPVNGIKPEIRDTFSLTVSKSPPMVGFKMLTMPFRGQDKGKRTVRDMLKGTGSCVRE